ncbi:hypothetical protein E4T56_gene16682 [Termitomyces sp. T112]|nr:hypothetical protein E4T56_gene16682 [Termitomyces sp. T112]
MSMISCRSSSLLRRLPPTLPPSIRRNSSKSRTLSGLQGPVVSHVIAGVLGGLLVTVGGYTWYYFSPIRPMVENLKTSNCVAEDVKKGFAKNFEGGVMESLRKTVKAYVAVVPGAEILIDTAFDSLGDIVGQHREEVDLIVTKALEEVQRLARNGTDGIQTALAMMDILKVHLSEIQALGAKTRNTVEPLLERAQGEI